MLNSIENNLYKINDGVNSFSHYIDETITQEESSYTYTDSYIHMQIYNKKIQSSKNDIGVNFKVRLRLPNLKEKYRLVLDNDDNKIAQDEFEDSSETVAYKDDNYNLSLQYKTFKKYINFQTSAGIKFRKSPYLFLKAVATKEYDITQKWYLEASQTLQLSTKKSLENTTSLNLHRDINEKLHFVNHNEYYWNEKENIDNTYNSLRLNHKLSPNQIFNYVIGLSSNNSESNFQTKNYDAYLSYKHYVRKWLYFDIVPKVFWDRENDFDAKYAFQFNIGIVLGK